MIGLIDSGIGGRNCFAVGTEFHQMVSPYFRPYGNMSDNELAEVMLSHLAFLSSIKEKYIVCFTLATFLARYNIEPTETHSILELVNNNDYDAVICTPRSAEYFRQLGKIVIAEPNLALHIENNIVSPNSFTNKYNLNNKRLLLGCTHYYNIAETISEIYNTTNLVVPRYT